MAQAGEEAAALAVVIPHYNDGVRLGRCLAALAGGGEGGGGGGAAEIVVVDNGSTEPLDALRAAHPSVRFVTEPSPGAAAARNRGVAETRAPVIAFLDADCLPAPDWIATARRAAKRGTVIGGRIEVFDETPPPRSGAEAFETVFAFDQRAYIERKGFTVTANMVVPRDLFLDVGGFVVGVSEDLDWCRRATARGYAIRYEPALAVRHPSRSDWPALRRKWRRLTAESFGLTGGGARIDWRARAGWAARAVAVALSAAAHSPLVLRHPALTGPERRRGLGTLWRLRLARALWMLRQAVTGAP